ncbi:MAG: hypothetical protein SFY32_04150 [Bacteroidota bacterium]|nr:hypothetical protein [Bacteroidota bacterium]
MKKASVFIPICLFVAFISFSFQIVSTQIKFTVLNNLGKPVEGARVRVYEKEEDYKKDQNYEQQVLTNEKGIAHFKKLKVMPYYVNVVKDNMNNWGNGEKTDTLVGNTFNKMTIVIQE